jgi:hypothetical protein
VTEVALVVTAGIRCRFCHNALHNLRASRARSSLAHLKRNELDRQVLKLPWQRLPDRRLDVRQNVAKSEANRSLLPIPKGC